MRDRSDEVFKHGFRPRGPVLVLAGWAGAGKGVDPPGGTKSRGRLEEHPPFPHLVALGRQCRYVSDISVGRHRVFG